MGYKCVFCQHLIAENFSTVRDIECSFNNSKPHLISTIDDYYKINLNFLYCPNCKKVGIKAEYKGRLMPKDTIIPIFPISGAKQFPDYIPQAIRDDYTEAYAILHLSPKASATLSRRCLQGMIRDFWGITGKKNLYEEVSALQSLILPSQWRAIDAIRQIGNIGAHMEQDTNIIVDIEQEDAHKLIKLIEILLKNWYIERHEHEELCSDITGINQDMQSLRK